MTIIGPKRRPGGDGTAVNLVLVIAPPHANFLTNAMLFARAAECCLCYRTAASDSGPTPRALPLWDRTRLLHILLRPRRMRRDDIHCHREKQRGIGRGGDEGENLACDVMIITRRSGDVDSENLPTTGMNSQPNEVLHMEYRKCRQHKRSKVRKRRSF